MGVFDGYPTFDAIKDAVDYIEWIIQDRDKGFRCIWQRKDNQAFVVTFSMTIKPEYMINCHVAGELISYTDNGQWKDKIAPNGSL